MRPWMPLLPLLLAACRTHDKLPDDGDLLDTGGLSDLDSDGDGYTADEDCDDNNSVVHPGASELCDGVDNDCDGTIDEDVTTTFYADTDGDGFGDAGATAEGCEAPAGYVPNGNDCDDSDSDSYPAAPERCDGVDNDCDGIIDEDVATTFYGDADGDGYGDPAAAVEDCDPDPGYVANADDCDDTAASAFPGGEEVCDGLDNNCDGSVDEGVTTTWYVDTDGDGYGITDTTTESCDRPTGYAAAPGDCDDTRADVRPDAVEVCNTLDDDCDGAIDEDVTTTFYADTDSDGYGDAASSTDACTAPSGYVANADDCDDTSAGTSPVAAEVCDGADNDCDGTADEGVTTVYYRDADGDGYGDTASRTDACALPSGYSATDGDCDDAEADANPGETEVCDAIDNDCDGDTDEGVTTTFYADDDSDGYGDPDDTTEACTRPSGYLSDRRDCDDTDAAIHPDALEVCDGADNNCDGDTDGEDAWWDDAWPYRIPVTLTGASTDVDGPPVAVDVDFRAALDALGDSDAFDPDTLRVVLQDCGLGQPELPSQFLDAWVGIFDKADPSDTTGDEAGAVVFLYDEDGDYSSLEALAAGGRVAVALYFGGTASAPGYTTDLASSSASLSTTLTDATFSSSAGGMLSSLLYDRAPDLMSQADSCCGNSIYMSSWDTDPQDSSGTLTEVEAGPIFAAVSATGSRSSSAGAYRYTYTYWMFAGRPELYSRVYQVTTASSRLSHPSDYTSGIRPWESRSDDLTGASTTYTVDSTGYLYADASDSGWGVAFSYVQAPDYPVGITFYDPYLIVSGNDVGASGAGSPVTLSSGTAYFDHVVMVVLPHAGTFTDVQDTLTGLVEGVGAAASAAEAQ